MRNDSYGVFDIKLISMDNEEDVTTLQWFNHMTKYGMDRMLNILAGKIDGGFANYIRIGTSTNPIDYASNDIEDVVFGYYEPNGVWDKNIESTVLYTEFHRNILQPGKYTQMAIYHKDMVTGEMNLVAAASGTIETRENTWVMIGHSITTDTTPLVIETTHSGVPVNISLTTGNPFVLIKSLYQHPDKVAIVASENSPETGHLLGNMSVSDWNEFYAIPIKVSITNNRTYVKKIDVITCLNYKGLGYANISDELPGSELSYNNYLFQLDLSTPVYLLPGETLTLSIGFTAQFGTNFNSLDNFVGRYTGLGYTTEFWSKDYSAYWILLDSTSNTNVSGSYSNGYTYTIRNQRKDIPYLFKRGGNNHLNAHWGAVTTNTGLTGIDVNIVATYNYLTRELTVIDPPSDLGYVRVFTELPFYATSYDSVLVNGKMTIPTRMKVRGRLKVQYIDTAGNKSNIVSIKSADIVYTPTKDINVISINRKPQAFYMGSYLSDNYQSSYFSFKYQNLDTSFVGRGDLPAELVDTGDTWRAGYTDYNHAKIPEDKTHIVIRKDGLCYYQEISTIPDVTDVGLITTYNGVSENHLVKALPVMYPEYFKTGVNQGNVIATMPDDGEVVFIERGPNGHEKVLFSKTVTAGEVVKENIENLFNPHQFDTYLFVHFRKDGYLSEGWTFEYMGSTYLPSSPTDFNLDLGTMRLTGPVSAVTKKIAIKHWNIPVYETEIPVDRRWVDIDLSAYLQPNKQYVLWFVGNDGVYSAHGQVLNPNTIDPLPPAISDLSMLTGDVNLSPGNNSYMALPKPNFMKYGIDKFAGEINGEPIINKTAVELGYGHWECAIETLNWKVKFRHVGTYTGNNGVHLTGNSVEDYISADWSGANPAEIKFRMWTDWLPYYHSGLDAFITSVNKHTAVYDRHNSPFENNDSSIGVTVHEQNGYYREMIDYKSPYNSWAGFGGGKYFNNDYVQSINPKFMGSLPFNLAHNKLDTLNIYINGVLATVTPTLTDGVMTSVLISTPDITFSYAEAPGARWVLESPTVDTYTADDVIKIDFVNTVGLNRSDWYYFKQKYGIYITEYYFRAEPSFDFHIWSNREAATITVYYKPNANIPEYPIFTSISPYNNAVSGFCLFPTESWYAVDYLVGGFYIDNQLATRTETSNGFTLSANGVIINVTHSDSGFIFIMDEASASGDHVFTYVKKSFEVNYVTVYDELAVTEEGYNYGYNDLYMLGININKNGNRVTPLIVEELPLGEVDPADIRPYFVANDTIRASLDDFADMFEVNGLPITQVYYRDVALLVIGEEPYPDTYVEDLNDLSDYTYLIYNPSNSILYIPPGTTGRYEITLKDKRVISSNNKNVASGVKYFVKAYDIKTFDYREDPTGNNWKGYSWFYHAKIILDNTDFNEYGDGNGIVVPASTITSYSQSPNIFLNVVDLYDYWISYRLDNDLEVPDESDVQAFNEWIVIEYGAWLNNQLEITIDGELADISVVTSNYEWPGVHGINIVSPNKAIYIGHDDNKYEGYYDADTRDYLTGQTSIRVVTKELHDIRYVKHAARNLDIWSNTLTPYRTDYSHLQYLLNGYYYKFVLDVNVGINPPKPPAQQGEVSLFPPNDESVIIGLDGEFDIYVDGQLLTSTEMDLYWAEYVNNMEGDIVVDVSEDEFHSSRWAGHESVEILIDSETDIYVDGVLLLENVGPHDLYDGQIIDDVQIKIDGGDESLPS